MTEKMSVKDFKLKWAHGMRRGKPAYVSCDKMLIPFDLFIVTCDVSGNNYQHHFEPSIRIECYSCLPELGIIAVSERKTNGSIFILNYPEMSKVLTLQQTNDGYSHLEFLGLKFLLSLQIKNCCIIDLWNWSTGEKTYSISEILAELETLNFNLLCNPLWWYQAFLQSNRRLILLEVKNSDDKYKLNVTSYFLLEDKKGNIKLSSKNKMDDQNDFMSTVIDPLLKILTIECFCWLPENNILVVISSGILKVEYETFTVQKLIGTKSGISSMMFCKSGLFIGYKTGFIDIVSISGHHWNVIETIKVGHAVNHLILSPNYKFLTITTIKESIFLLKVGSQSNVNHFLESDARDTVGVSFIGPLGHHCVSAKKSGILHIFRTVDGSIRSTFQLDDQITSMASSPLCSCIVTGSSVGFLYFIDATDPCRPRIIHCERPYEMQVDHLRFDNFGRFLVACSKNHGIKIWNGLPSNNFTFLGSKNFSTQVKDLALFSKEKSDETYLLLLTASKSSSEKESDSIFIAFIFPNDLNSNPHNYQINVFGTLSEDALRIQNQTEHVLSSKMDVHYTLGVIFSSLDKVQRIQIWSDMETIQQDDLLSIKNVNNICVSPNQRWLSVTDLRGHVNLYTSKGFILCGNSQEFADSENNWKSYMGFPYSLNNLIYARENGLILFYEWLVDMPYLQTIPEWVDYCFSQFNKQNECLRAMDEEDKINLLSPYVSMNGGNIAILSEISKEIEVCICVINYNLDKLLSDSNVTREPITSSFVLREDSIEKLSSENRRRISFLVCEEIQVEEEKEKQNMENAVKILSSISLGLVIQNFSKRNIIKDVNLTQVMNSVSKCEGKDSLHTTSSRSFTESVKFRCKKERLTAMAILVKQICDLKVKFNDEFDKLFERKLSVSKSLDEAYFEAKRITQTLPSKAERDFWNASVVERDYGKLSVEETLVESISGEDTESDTIMKAKCSIENFAKSARNIQERFDSDVQTLLLKKRYCDCNIFRYEVKIQSMLLFALVEDEFSKWRERIDKEMINLRDFHSEIQGLMKEILDIEKSLQEVYFELQKLERNFSGKFESKCNITVKSEKKFLLLKKQPSLQLDNDSENPFWSTNISTNVNDMTLISKELLSKNPCPNKIKYSDWEYLYNKRIKILKIGILLRNIQSQFLHITSTKHKCADISRNVSINLNIKQWALINTSKLISKFSVTFYSAVTVQLENAYLRLNINSDTNVPTFNNLPDFEDEYWKDIDADAYNIQKLNQDLYEIENLFKRLYTLKSDMNMKSIIVNTEHSGFVKSVTEKLEEMHQNYAKTKAEAEVLLDGHKKSIFKVLKSRLLNDS